METPEKYAKMAEKSAHQGLDGDNPYYDDAMRDRLLKHAQVYATLAVAASFAPEKRTVARDYWGKVIDPAAFIPGDVP